MNRSVALSHPKENMMAIVLAIAFILQISIGLLGLLFYWIFIKLLKLKWWWLACFGLGIVLMGSVMHYLNPHFFCPFSEYFTNVLLIHFLFWKYYFKEGLWTAFNFLYRTQFNFIIGISFITAGFLGAIDLFFRNPHEVELRALHQKKSEEKPQIPDNQIVHLLSVLGEKDFDGTVLGVSKNTGQYVVIPDQAANEIILVLGTTGSGKTITLRRFFLRAILQEIPLIIITAKPTDKDVEWVKALAVKFNKKFYGFYCDDHKHYNSLAHGGYTELKDKVICLKDEWESDHYKTIAEGYLQTVFQILIQSGKQFDLKKVADCLDFDELCKIVREIDDPILTERVERLQKYSSKDIIGLQAHLDILVHSELGEYFTIDDSAFTLEEVINQNGIAYFALPALQFPSFSQVLGKLIINDLKTIIGRQSTDGKKIFAVFDKFSVFAGEQSLNLVNMGREKGLHSIFGTQGLADLEKANRNFKPQFMNCVNTLICHRLNDQESAEAIANWIGTQDAFPLTAQLNLKENNPDLASIRKSKEYIVHPDAIKQELQKGEAFYVTKVGGFQLDRIKVKYS